MKKKIVLISLIVVVIIATTFVYAAACSQSFSFSKVGDYITMLDYKQSGGIRIITSNQNSTLNLNLSKKILFGYKYISSSVQSLSGSPKRIESTWSNQTNGTYKANIDLTYY